LGKQEGSIEKKRGARSRRQDGAEPARTSEPRKVVRAADLPPPRRVSDEDFDALCVTFDVERDERQALRQQLDNIVDVFASRLLEERRRPDRQGDRDWLSDALKATQKARAALPSRPGKAAEHPVRVGGALLNPVITVSWLVEKFPAFGELLAKREEWKPGNDVSATIRAEFIDRETLPVLSALLGEVELVLQVAVNLLPLMPGGKGGRQRLTHRAHMIANLTQCWRSLGRTPTSGPNSPFTAFCEAVFDAIGWPTEGVEAAVPDALYILRYHPEIFVG